MSTHYHQKPLTCLRCESPLGRSTSADPNDDHPPDENCVSFCLECGLPMMFERNEEGELYLRRVNTHEYEYLLTQEDFLHALFVVHHHLKTEGAKGTSGWQ